jgi:hypothetical protein
METATWKNRTSLANYIGLLIWASSTAGDRDVSAQRRPSTGGFPCFHSSLTHHQPKGREVKKVALNTINLGYWPIP